MWNRASTTWDTCNLSDLRTISFIKTVYNACWILWSLVSVRTSINFNKDGVRKLPKRCSKFAKKESRGNAFYFGSGASKIMTIHLSNSSSVNFSGWRRTWAGRSPHYLSSKVLPPIFSTFRFGISLICASPRSLFFLLCSCPISVVSSGHSYLMMFWMTDFFLALK
jgi:hypothetical protein